MKRQYLFALALLALSAPARAGTPAPSDPVLAQVREIRDQWAAIKFNQPDPLAQKQQMEALEEKALKIAAANPDRAEPKIWAGITLASEAGMHKGISALPEIKQAKEMFEQAIALDPKAEGGAAQTSLGSLYYQVPGWPLAFGDNKKAEHYLEAGLAVSPDDIDANYFYGDFLLHMKKYTQAAEVLKKALNAPARPDRALADAGRHREIEEDLALARKKGA